MTNPTKTYLEMVAQYVVDAESVLDKVVWVPDLSEVEEAAPLINFKAYRGKGGEWDFLVVGVDVPGYDPIRQYHGTATKLGVILKLPPELARKAGERAEGPGPA